MLVGSKTSVCIVSEHMICSLETFSVWGVPQLIILEYWNIYAFRHEMMVPFENEETAKHKC